MMTDDTSRDDPADHAGGGRSDWRGPSTQRVADQLRSLAPDDWSKPTDCPLWDVRAMAGHTTGMLATFTGYRTADAAR